MPQLPDPEIGGAHTPRLACSKRNSDQRDRILLGRHLEIRQRPDDALRRSAVLQTPHLRGLVARSWNITNGLWTHQVLSTSRFQNLFLNTDMIEK